jgi:hypothetical protein
MGENNLTNAEATQIARVYRTPAGNALPVVHIPEPNVCRECVITVDFRHAPPIVSREYDRKKRWLEERMP